MAIVWFAEEFKEAPDTFGERPFKVRLRLSNMNEHGPVVATVPGWVHHLGI